MDVAETEQRDGEVAVAASAPDDASLRFVGVIHTPWQSRGECPKQGEADGPVCEIEVFEPWVRALEGVAGSTELEVLYWLDEARRDLVLQNPGSRGRSFGTFALRSPVRPNPIGLSRVRLLAVNGARLSVQGLDCRDGTPLLDLKPVRCPAAHRS